MRVHVRAVAWPGQVRSVRLRVCVCVCVCVRSLVSPADTHCLCAPISVHTDGVARPGHC